MIRQTVLPFKLKRTSERVTARSGLVLFAEFMRAMGVEELVDRHIPRPDSGRGFGAISYIKPLSMMLYGGGESIEDVREIREEPLRGALGFMGVPSSSAIGDWLRRMGQRGGIGGMERVNDGIVKKTLKGEDRKGYTLIIDPTIIASHKRDAQMTYVGCKGYRPVVATLRENGLVIAYEFKEGNDNGGKLRIIEKVFGKMPPGKRIEQVLLDAEYYSNEVIEYVEGKGVRWVIGVDKDISVKEYIKGIAEGDWRPLKTAEGVMTDREVAETVHTTNQGKVAFRLVVIRWRDRQGNLFFDTYQYHCIGTNILKEDPQEPEVPPWGVVWRYHGRAQIENHIKELKAGFGMEWMPSGDFRANAVHFAIGIMTYNLFIAQKLFTMPQDWCAKTIKSIRWLLVEVGGKLIEHGRRVVIKIAAGMEKYQVYLEMRRRTYELMLQ